MKQRNIEQIQIDFLVSALHQGSIILTENVLKWIRKKNDEVFYEINQIPISSLKDWKEEDGSIRHNSGKFFSIDGINVTTNFGLVESWDQPIINQPEIGFLGFITKKIDGVLHFLLQAKIEPGNLNIVQLSPTLQATRSNYTRVHQGSYPLYLEYFTGEKDVIVLIDQLQSEQGARFLQKRNRNIIIEIDKDDSIEIFENFIWLSLGQIKELLNYPNVVNMDTRTVISCINFGSYSETSLNLLAAFQQIGRSENNSNDSFIYSVLSKDNHLHDIQYVIQWMTSLKFKYELKVKRISINNMTQWKFDGNVIEHDLKKYFSVIGVNVKIGNREVVAWDQPMIKSAQEGIIGFLVKRINGIYHFLVQAKLESGNFDVIEMAPTVQCLTGNYRIGANEYKVQYLDFFLNPDKSKIWYSAYQSEEGGRFFQEQNLNIIVEVGDEFPIEVEPNYCWMTLNQLLSFVQYNNYLNIGARSLLSAIRFY